MILVKWDMLEYAFNTLVAGSSFYNQEDKRKSSICSISLIDKHR